jgi:hypothetical protein
MNAAVYFIVTMILAAVLYFGFRWLVRACSKYRGVKIVSCPETATCAVVEIDALHASLTSTVGRPDIRLKSCSRWPMKSQCGQECLANLDVAPGECLVSGLLMRWYRGRYCVYCGKPAEELHWLDHESALQTKGKLVQWGRVPGENFSIVLKTHLPVCWNCYITQPFREDHPDQMVDGPWRHSIPGDADGLSASRRA